MTVDGSAIDSGHRSVLLDLPPGATVADLVAALAARGQPVGSSVASAPVASSGSTAARPRRAERPTDASAEHRRWVSPGRRVDAAPRRRRRFRSAAPGRVSSPATTEPPEPIESSAPTASSATVESSALIEPPALTESPALTEPPEPTESPATTSSPRTTRAPASTDRFVPEPRHATPAPGPSAELHVTGRWTDPKPARPVDPPVWLPPPRAAERPAPPPARPLAPPAPFPRQPAGLERYRRPRRPATHNRSGGAHRAAAPCPAPPPRRPVDGMSRPHAARPPIGPEPAILGLTRISRSRVGSRLFVLFFVLVFAVIAAQMVAALLMP